MRSSSSRALHEKIIPTAVIISRKKKKKERKTENIIHKKYRSA
jgi:hypothetical protein